jgi:hypothetical protein
LLQQAAQAVNSALKATVHHAWSTVKVGLRLLHSACVPGAARLHAAAAAADAAAMQACAKFIPPPYITETLPQAPAVLCFTLLRAVKWTTQLAPPPNTCYHIACDTCPAEATTKSTQCALEVNTHRQQYLAFEAAAQLRAAAAAAASARCRTMICDFCLVETDRHVCALETNRAAPADAAAQQRAAKAAADADAATWFKTFLAFDASRALYCTPGAKSCSQPQLQLPLKSTNAALLVNIPASTLVFNEPGGCLQLLLVFCTGTVVMITSRRLA